MSASLIDQFPHGGVFQADAGSMTAFAAAAAPAALSVIDLSDCADHDALLAALATALAAPDWFGSNFDALYDRLSDPEAAPMPTVLCLHGLARLAEQAPDTLATLIEVLQAAAEERAQLGHPLWCLVDRGLETPPSAIKA